MTDTLYIVRGTKAERSGVLFVMRDSDDRFGGDYTPVVRGCFEPSSRGQRFTGEDGSRYLVYADWSARETRICGVCLGRGEAHRPSTGRVEECSACGATGWRPVD